MNYKRKYQYFIYFFLIILLFSCNPARHIPEGEYLLLKSGLKIDNNKVNKEELESYIKQKPNRKILSVFRFHLGVYNIFYGDNAGKWRTKIANVVGEEPVVFNNYQLDKSVKQMNLYLNNHGYFESDIKVDTNFNVKKRKVKVKYIVEANRPYTIRNITYKIKDDTIKKLVMEDTVNTVLKKGMNYNLDILENERQRITTLLKNEGYYYFSKEYIYYEADSNLNSHKMDIVLGVENRKYISSDSASYITVHKKYKINKVYYYMNFDPLQAVKEGDKYLKEWDTLSIDNISFLYKENLFINPEVIMRANYLIKNHIYSIYDVEQTYKHLIATRNFKIVNIQFVPSDDSVSGNYLDVNVQITSFKRQSYSTEIVGTNSSGNLGIGGSLNYQHKSLFRGAEIFDFKINGGIERQTILQDNDNDESIQQDLAFNTIEFGGETGISIPRFIFFNEGKNYDFTKKYNPQTRLSFAYNYQKRSRYTRTIANLSFGYYFKGNDYTQHIINPFEVNMVDIPWIDSVFYTSLNNPYIRNSYKNYLITSTDYTFIFNNQKLNKYRNFHYLRLNIEPAGNVISTINSIFKVTNEGGAYLVLNRKYAQYFKSDVDYRYYQYFNADNKLVYRFFAGIGYPYGNSTAMPFVKQYYCGGANGIRAWPVRGLGPGSYYDSTQVFNYQTADLKLEMNMEYRFHWFWIVEGALFVDAGNIWSITDNDTREGALFRPDSFYNDIAIGTGFGFRFDFTFFVFRFDFGIKVRDPAITVVNTNINDPAHIEKNKWVLFTERSAFFKDMISNINIGIGYPF